MKPTYIPVLEFTPFSEKYLTEEQTTCIVEDNTISFGDNDKTLVTVERFIEMLTSAGFEDINPKIHKLKHDESGHEIYIDLEA